MQQALQHGQGRFYGIGLTTGSRATSCPPPSATRRARPGLVAVKIVFTELEREWRNGPDIVLASDTHGVVFLASRDAWRYRLLNPLTAQDRGELAATRQYADQPLAPLLYRSERPVAGGGVVVRPQDPAEHRPLLWQTLERPAATGGCTCCTTPAPWPAPAAGPPWPLAACGWPWRCWC